MKQKTDLDAVKNVAIALLMTDYHKTKFSPMVIQHPFTNSGIVGIAQDGGVQLIDITRNRAEMRRWQDQVREQIENSKSPFQIYMMCSKPYGLAFVELSMPHLSREDFSKMLANAWIRSENPNCDPNVSKAKLLSMFNEADPEILMDDGEQAALKNLEDSVTIFRGVTPYNEKNINAMSWTLDYETASWFAHRFDEDGTVYEATIDKKHILALFNSRNESEVVVDPQYLKDIMEAPVPEFGMSMT